MKAVVMAGGLGSRLRPLTIAIPKPLLPVAGRPMIDHILRHAREHGVSEAVVTVQYLAATIRSFLGDGSDLGIDVRYSTEHRPLGTAGGVRVAAADFDDDFLVLSGDTVTDIDLSALMSVHRERGADLTLCLTRRDDPREFGVVDLDEDQRVRRFLEKPAWGEVFTDTVSTGIYAVSPRVLAQIPDDEAQDWSTDVIPRLLAHGGHVAGFVSSGYWEDVGDLAAYRHVQVDALEGRVRLDIPGTLRGEGLWIGEGVALGDGVEVSGPAFIGAHSTIEAGAAILPHTVVGASAVIRRGARLERALLLDHVYAGIDTSLTGCVVGRSVEIGSGSRLADGAVVADECRLEQEVDVSTGSLVYPGKTLESGSRIHGAVVWDSTGHRFLVQAGGLSGTMSVDITPENVVRAASALASVLPKDAVVSVARDQSRAARSYSSLLTGALTASGITVRDHRVAPAPVLRDDVGRHAAAGVLVRATAGRPERLDIVLLDSAGRDISDAESRRISRVFERREFRRPFPGAVGDVVPPEHALEEYAARVRSGISLEGVAQADLTVVVDSAGGSSALALPTVLRGVDVDLVLLGGRLEESRAVVSDDDRRAGLRTLADTVVSMGASLGLSIDSTGERLSIVDDLGQVMDDDRALLVVMDLVASEAHAGHVVLPVTASRLSEQVAGFHGVEVRRVPSTQTFVADEHALLSSDGQGGFAVRGSGGRRDAIATALALIGLVARTNLTLSAIESRIPRSVTLRHAVQTPWAAKGAVMRAVQAQAGTRTADHTDGVRVLEDDGSWCLVLPDAHEPLTRLWVEAPSYARGMQVGQEWIALVENVVAEHRRDRE